MIEIQTAMLMVDPQYSMTRPAAVISYGTKIPREYLRSLARTRRQVGDRQTYQYSHPRAKPKLEDTNRSENIVILLPRVGRYADISVMAKEVRKLS